MKWKLMVYGRSRKLVKLNLPSFGLLTLIWSFTAQASFFPADDCSDFLSRAKEYNMFLACETSPSCLGRFGEARTKLKQYLKEESKELLACKAEDGESLLVKLLSPDEAAPDLAFQMVLIAQKKKEQVLTPQVWCEVKQRSLSVISQVGMDTEKLGTEKAAYQERAFETFKLAHQALGPSEKRNGPDGGICEGPLSPLLGFTEGSPELKIFPVFYLTEVLKILPSSEKDSKTLNALLRSFIERGQSLNPIENKAVLTLIRSQSGFQFSQDLFGLAIQNLNLPAAQFLKPEVKGVLSANDLKGWFCQAEESKSPWTKKTLFEALNFGSIFSESELIEISRTLFFTGGSSSCASKSARRQNKKPVKLKPTEIQRLPTGSPKQSSTQKTEPNSD